MPVSNEKLGEEVASFRDLHLALKDELHRTERDLGQDIALLRTELASFKAQVGTLISVVKWVGSICGTLLLGSIGSGIYWAADLSAQVRNLASVNKELITKQDEMEKALLKQIGKVGVHEKDADRYVVTSRDAMSLAMERPGGSSGRTKYGVNDLYRDGVFRAINSRGGSRSTQWRNLADSIGYHPGQARTLIIWGAAVMDITLLAASLGVAIAPPRSDHETRRILKMLIVVFASAFIFCFSILGAVAVDGWIAGRIG